MASKGDVDINDDQDIKRMDIDVVKQMRSELKEEMLDDRKNIEDNYSNERIRQNQEEKDVKELTGTKMKGQERTSLKTQEISNDQLADSQIQSSLTNNKDSQSQYKNADEDKEVINDLLAQEKDKDNNDNNNNNNTNPVVNDKDSQHSNGDSNEQQNSQYQGMTQKYQSDSKKQLDNGQVNKKYTNQSTMSNGKFKRTGKGSTSEINSLQQLKNKRKQQSQNQDSEDEESEEFHSFTIERDIDPDELEDPENYFEQLSMSFYNSHKKGDVETRRLIEESLKAFVLGHQKDMQLQQQQRNIKSRKGTGKGGRIYQKEEKKMFQDVKRGMGKKDDEDKEINMMMLVGKRQSNEDYDYDNRYETRNINSNSKSNEDNSNGLLPILHEDRLNNTHYNYNNYHSNNHPGTSAHNTNTTFNQQYQHSNKNGNKIGGIILERHLKQEASQEALLQKQQQFGQRDDGVHRVLPNSQFRISRNIKNVQQSQNQQLYGDSNNNSNGQANDQLKDQLDKHQQEQIFLHDDNQLSTQRNLITSLLLRIIIINYQQWERNNQILMELISFLLLSLQNIRFDLIIGKDSKRSFHISIISLSLPPLPHKVLKENINKEFLTKTNQKILKLSYLKKKILNKLTDQYFLTMNSQPKQDDQKLEKKLKPCCACPETKKLRDVCIMNNGEVNCLDHIEAHKVCLRSLGFNPQ